CVRRPFGSDAFDFW
nr:immunoglobulin heavy chain junction region [Macaca mulatta]MOX61779.1 immunoglobulin heavy chain junction region [Macaca mulatta]MOX61895.1 immunoglobulin heavy chain junction region [Macaca mulatta]MOX64287.1 immunoglobulin heavy chain junction region [Macaca mulatta]